MANINSRLEYLNPATGKPFKAAVIMGTYNRGHLLRRSLENYAMQTENDFYVHVFDDGSTDDTGNVVIDGDLTLGLNIKYTRLEKQPGKWRDSASFINAGIAYALHVAKCPYIFITHPEIIPGLALIETGIKYLQRPMKARFNAKGYYLTVEQQKRIDKVDLTLGLEQIRLLPNFYEENEKGNGNPDYTARAIDRALSWGSWIFGGFTADGWRDFGGVFESEVWGAVDIEMHDRAKALGYHTVTPQDIRAMVIHQNHDDPETNVITPRNEEWRNALQGAKLERRYHLISKERWENMDYTPI